jgi:hypothetical protein
MLLIIDIKEKWSTAASGLAAGAAPSCHKKTIRPKALVPRRLVRIVTVNPPKGFCYGIAGNSQNEPTEARTASNLRSY